MAAGIYFALIGLLLVLVKFFYNKFVKKKVQKTGEVLNAVSNHAELKINNYIDKHSKSDELVIKNHSKESIDNMIIENINEDEIYEKVMLEIEEDKKVKSTWAKALSQSDGDDKKANSLYIKFRVNQVKEEIHTENVKKKDFELKQKVDQEELKINKTLIDQNSKNFDYVSDIPQLIYNKLASDYIISEPYEKYNNIKYIFIDRTSKEECVLKYSGDYYVLFSNKRRRNLLND